MCKMNSIKGTACLEAFSQKESKMGILPLNRDKIQFCHLFNIKCLEKYTLSL